MGSSSSKKKQFNSVKEFPLQDVTDFKNNIKPPNYLEIDNGFNPKINYQHLQNLIDNVEKSSVGSQIYFNEIRYLYGYLCILSNLNKYPYKIYEPITNYEALNMVGNIVQSAKFILENRPNKNWSLINGLYVIDY